MKRIIVIAGLALLASWSSYGQGTVVFANNASSRVWIDAVPSGASTAPVNDPRSIEAGTKYSVELMWAPAATPDEAFGIAARKQGATATVGGPFQQRGIFSGGNRTITEVNGGTQLKMQVRVWETVAGASYAEAVLGGDQRYRAGTSAILLVTTGNPNVTPAVPPAPLTGAGLTHFAVTPIPEPSAIGLGLLGVGALLLLRRRK